MPPINRLPIVRWWDNVLIRHDQQFGYRQQIQYLNFNLSQRMEIK